MQERATPSPYIVPKTLIEGVIFICYTHRRRGVAQPGSAPAWGAGGRQFESGRPDHCREPMKFKLAVLTVSTSAFRGERDDTSGRAIQEICR